VLAVDAPGEQLADGLDAVEQPVPGGGDQGDVPVRDVQLVALGALGGRHGGRGAEAQLDVAPVRGTAAYRERITGGRAEGGGQ